MISARVAVPFGLALAAGGLAVYLSGNPTAEIASATTAVILASVGGVMYYSDRSFVGPSSAPPAEVEPDPGAWSMLHGRIDAALQGGAIAREELVLLLDFLERSEVRYDRASAPVEELHRLSHLSVADFRAYLLARLDRLEGRT